MKVNKINNGFEIEHNGITFIRHTKEEPFLFVGEGDATFDMYRGNFKIKDYVVERAALRDAFVDQVGNEYFISFHRDNERKAKVKIYENGKGQLEVRFVFAKPEINRVWLRVLADKDEKIYGCGEQMSYFNLRGKNFPLWTSEPGVGRNKNTYTTFQADSKDKAGGDYYTTNYPQPTFVSSKKYYCHLDCTAYMDFDFRNDDFYELQAWDVPEVLIFDSAESFVKLAEKIGDFFGKQPELPEWVNNGIILGIQGGTDVVKEKVKKARTKGVKVAGVWCQDWAGVRFTSFGKRLNWNWQWNPDIYKDLDKEIYNLKKDGVRFLAYNNPYLVEGYNLYDEAKEKGYLATKEDGSDYLVDFGEFYCGVVDFTNDAACEWYKNTIIKKNMIDFGVDGWMADFGEYLPTDCKLSNNVSAEIMHNAWPTLWAKVNYEAVEEKGKLGEIVYFMRAGFTGVQKYNTLLWAGDQCVDWCIDDGPASVVCGALSSGIVGNCFHHSDTGGYTTLHGLKRSKELFMRWADMNAFTPFFRTHEGNRPDDNHQFDTDDETLEHLARMTTVFATLKPYIRHCVKEAAEKGLPVQRPIFMHYEDDKEAYDIKYQYMFGRDAIVAPVYSQGVSEWKAYLPEDEWIHAWTGKEYKGGWHTVDAPIGKPPVFYKKDSKYKEVFEALKA